MDRELLIVVQGTRVLQGGRLQHHHGCRVHVALEGIVGVDLRSLVLEALHDRRSQQHSFPLDNGDVVSLHAKVPVALGDGLVDQSDAAVLVDAHIRHLELPVELLQGVEVRQSRHYFVEQLPHYGLCLCYVVSG